MSESANLRMCMRFFHDYLLFINYEVIKKADFSFEFNNLNLLTLNAGSLPHVPKRQYEIYVSTIYYGIEYYQKVVINIENTTQIPVALIE